MKTKSYGGQIDNFQNRNDWDLGGLAEALSKLENPPVMEFDGKKWDGKSFPIYFSGVAATYENLAEVKASEDWPGDNDILKMVNQKKVTSAKAQDYQRIVGGFKKQYEESADFKRKTFIDGAIAMGFSQAEAEALAASKIK